MHFSGFDNEFTEFANPFSLLIHLFASNVVAQFCNRFLSQIHQTMKKTALTIIVTLIILTASANNHDTIMGKFPLLANQMVKLTGFNGFKTYSIDSTKVSEDGIFQLKYSPADHGMGYLTAEDNKQFIVILAEEELQLEGEALAYPETVKILSGEQNLIFVQYASEHPRREQALSAWHYLENIYRHDPLFSIHKETVQAIGTEKKRIRAEDSTFLAQINPQSYVSWYLPARKLISSVSVVAQYRPEEIPATLAAFRVMDYADKRLYKSGMLKDAIESHYWLIENSGLPLDSVYKEMNISTDLLIENLSVDEDKMNEITGHLFRFLESRSLFGASEYLAIKLLNETSCTVDGNLANQLESYRAMKIGNIAPEIDFTGHTVYPANTQIKSLDDLKADYTVVVFAAGWCPHCMQEAPELVKQYPNWKEQGVEVVMVSLDETAEKFEKFANGFPFISLCDFKKWESPVMKDYHVFATPTMYLLDGRREILLRPTSVRQLDSWVDWYLVEGNK
jgi:peroxiredoxin